MPFYVAGINRKTRKQDYLFELKTYGEAVNCLVEHWTDKQYIALIEAESKAKFAKLCPGFMNIPA